MAVLFITEYENKATDGRGYPIEAGQEPAIAEQTVAIGVTSAASNAFNARTHFVRVHTDAVCSIAFGKSPTAVATAKRMAAGSTEFFGVPPGQSFKIAVITNT